MNRRFWNGIGIGLAVSAATAAALTMKPKKKTMKASAHKAIHAMEGAMENLTDHMGM